MLKDYTKKYIEAFDAKDLEAIELLLDTEFVLEDPVVKRIKGKGEALKIIQGIFDSCDKLSFTAKNIYQDESTTFIEFTLILDEIILQGVDILEWSNNKIIELRAYLDVPK